MKIKYSFEQWCLDNNHQDYLDLWDYELNDTSPGEIGYSVSRPYYFKCPKGIHPSETRYINSMTSGKNPLLCRQCHSLGQWMVDMYGDDAIDKLWSNKNNINPFHVAKHADQDAWFKCINNPEHLDYLKKVLIFTQGHMCPMCSGRGLIIGYNDVATTHPWLVKYFSDKNQAKMFTAGSNKSVDIVCPDCGHVTQKSIYDLTSQPFNCQKCGDGSSYPNKFVHEFLVQLQEKYALQIYAEHVFEWSKNLSDSDACRRVYDFYVKFKNVDIIIEVHGNQHFNGSFCKYPGGRTLEEEQQNDIYKKDLALKNGILDSNYIVIDASKSNCDWILNSILHSNLSSVFEFNSNDINWIKCHEAASKSLTKTVADLWQCGEHNISEIARIIGKTRTTTIHYLKVASEIGWCSYIANQELYFSEKQIMCTNNGICFSSIGLCEKLSESIFGVKISRSSLDRVLSGKSVATHGLNFVNISKEDFLYRKNEFPNLSFGNLK